MKKSWFSEEQTIDTVQNSASLGRADSASFAQ